MVFKSILFNNESFDVDTFDEPPYFRDLNLDQVLNAILYPKKEYNLKSFFYIPLHNPDDIHYRIDIFKDLENDSLIDSLHSFAEQMRLIRRWSILIKKLDYEAFKEGRFLDTVLTYCEGVFALFTRLNELNLSSSGFKSFKLYLQQYIESPEFTSLHAEALRIKNSLTALTFCINIFQGGFSVKKFHNETTISHDIVETFSKFREDDPKDYRTHIFFGRTLSHIDAKILEFVARFYPKPFQDLHSFYFQHQSFADEIILTFDREIQFYLSILEFYTKFKREGLNFCYPEYSTSKDDIFVHQGFDIVLANKFLGSHTPIVCNDFFLQGGERLLVVSGPNQGGKTTFARMFGQSFYFASLGLPLPGTQAKIFLPDTIFTHFEREESIATLRGKLQDELYRVKVIFSQMTSASVIIINEIFTSTMLEDAVFLSKKIMNQLLVSDVLGVIVTFIDELSELGPQTVSMVSNIVPDNPSVRTFKITRKKADGLAYALSIAKKHAVTYQDIKERLQA